MEDYLGALFPFRAPGLVEFPTGKVTKLTNTRTGVHPDGQT